MEPAANLRRLRDLPDFEVADGHPDVRGWAVRGAAGTVLGTVQELLVDPIAQQVRYLDAQLDAPAPKRVLLPLRLASLDAETSSVFVPALTEAAVLAYPAYAEELVTPAYTAGLRQALGEPL
ncbi:PRC-barrel domain-containing protein [Hymenobacter caeli]|uniref:PRC-barrel domain-containing protein n=1 Tax=Hymenobacter caeli TaxID=2735894 RepID=A0ABX2FMV0_9BACT|nr:PRC-barrel domain-containing protein [Hymenobacter caeli]NRT18488.1 hypothetical protein [Hymenobacter caeli]